MLGASGHEKFDKRDEKLKRLHRLVRDLELEARGEHRKRDQDNRKGRFDSGETRYGTGPISLVPVNVRIVHIHGNPIDTETVRIHGSLVNVGTIHIHGNMQTEVQIPQRSDGPVTPPWML